MAVLQTKTISAVGSKGYHKFILTVTENSVDNNKNTSSISWELKMEPVIKGYDWYYSSSVPVTYKVSVAGTSYTGNIMNYNGTDTIILKNATINVAHDTKGEKSIECSIVVSSMNVAYLPGSVNISDTMKLTSIPRASSISSITNASAGGKWAIKWTPMDISYTYKFKIDIGDFSIQIKDIAPKQTTSYTYTYDSAEDMDVICAQLPNDTSGKLVATLYTYNSSGIQIGTSKYTGVITIPSSIKPKLGSIKLTPAAITVGDKKYNYLVKNTNKLTISGSGSQAGNGSTIKSYSIVGPSVNTTISSKEDNFSKTISAVDAEGTLTYTVVITDSRGRTASKKVTVTCYDYYAPYFLKFSVTKKDSTTKSKLVCTYNISYASVNDVNSINMEIFIDGVSKQNVNLSNMSGSVSISTDGLFTPTKSSCSVYAIITDMFNNDSTSSAVTVHDSSRAINITSDGTGIAFGMKAESKEMLQSNYRIKAPGVMASRETRPESITFLSELNRRACIEHYLADISKIEDGNNDHGGLPGDGHIIHCHWDGTEGYLGTQLYLRHKSGLMMSRGCDETGMWCDWRTQIDDQNYTTYVSPKPVVLFNGSSSNGTIEFSLDDGETLSNYKYLEIFYSTSSGNGNGSTRVYNPNGKTIYLNTVGAANATTTYINKTTYTIAGNGKTVTLTPNSTTMGRITVTDTSVATTSGSNNIHITRVLGYK